MHYDLIVNIDLVSCYTMYAKHMQKFASKCSQPWEKWAQFFKSVIF